VFGHRLAAPDGRPPAPKYHQYSWAGGHPPGIHDPVPKHATYFATNPNAVTPLSAGSFASPPLRDRPWVRWHIPATAEPAELQAELQQLSHAGIGGAELGQGAFPNTTQLTAILTKANQLGIKISLSHGPVSAPDGFSIDDDHARKILNYGTAFLDAGQTFDGDVPAPANANRKTLVAVFAYRCTTTPCQTSGPVAIDNDSAVNLTARVTATNHEGVDGGTTAGRLTWTAPASPVGAPWVLVAFWQQGLEAQPDLLSHEGAQILIRNLDRVLAPVKDLMRRNGGDFFYDSHSGDRGSPLDSWTQDMLAQFQRRRGYPLLPYLAALVTDPGQGFLAPPTPAFSFNGAERVRNDFYQARTDMWLDRQVEPLQDWAHNTYRYNLRLQPYGENSPTEDAIQAAAILDRPETEDLWFGDEVDNYLPLASAPHLTGNPWYSIECCAVVGQNYATTWQDTVSRLHKAFAGGVTKQIYHYYPYKSDPSSHWPGYSIFGPAEFSNAWGPRNPYWVDAPTYNAYLARNQHVLTQGQARVDVAVYMHKYVYPQPYASTPYGRHWVDPGLERAGYTRDYLDPALLQSPDATVSHRRLAADGPAYRALILDAQQRPAAPTDNGAMPVTVAARILQDAKAGLPVIVVGAAPDHTPFNMPADDATLRDTITALRVQPNVRQVPDEASVPQALKDLGVRPSAQPSSPSPVLSVRRAAGRTNYYWLYNQGQITTPFTTLIEPAPGEPVDVRFSLQGHGRPYQLDAWTGKITPIAEYCRRGDRVIVHVKLAREDATIIALSPNRRFGALAPIRHACSTNADEVVYAPDGALRVRSRTPGTFSTMLSHDHLVQTTIASVAAPIDLTDATWHLSVQDWQPANDYATTTGDAATETKKVPRELELTGLKPWSRIPELQDVSGIGTYITTFSLPTTWTGGHGAYLSLGEVFDSFAAKVNGTSVPINQISAEADIGRYLHPGTNTLQIRVATTLRNRLRTLDPQVAALPRQDYGLIGPVQVLPYGQAPLGNR
jgi:alpha-L-rhamnosidase